MTAPNLVWNTLYGLKSHKHLAAALFDLAAECARRAIEEPNVSEGTGLGKLVRMMAVGEAAELLVKSTLAGINPTLLAADRTNSATLYALIGSVRRIPGKISTLGLEEAVKRLSACRPLSIPEIVMPIRVFEVRNDAIHMGLAPSESVLEEALTELVALVDKVFQIRKELRQSHDWEAFWSPKHLQIVEARQQASYEQLRKNFQKLIAQAQTAYARLTTGLDQDALNRVATALLARVPEVDGDQTLRQHKCPACPYSLWVVYRVRRDIDIDDSDAPHSFAYIAKKSASVQSAVCPVCNLSLDQADIVLTDIPFALDLGEEEATPEEEEAWNDARYAEQEDKWGDFDGD